MTRNFSCSRTITAFIRSGSRAATRLPTRSAIRERSMAVAGAARARRLPRHQSRDGLALCRGPRIAGAAPIRRMEGSAANRCRPCAFGGTGCCSRRSDPRKHSSSALRWAAAAVLIGFGVYRLVRARHPRWVGMRVGFRDLTLWSFLMASAHGAGLMLVPVFLGTTRQRSDARRPLRTRRACRSRGRSRSPE